MRESSSVAAAPTSGMPGPARARRVADPRSPAGTAAGSPETTLRLADDHDRIAGELNDLVAGRLFAAGLDLPAARALTGDDEARGRIQRAISELDVAIRDIRDMVFDSCRARLPPGSRGQGRCVLLGAVQGGGAWAAGAPPAAVEAGRCRPGQGHG
jgi:Histidine kinase